MRQVVPDRPHAKHTDGATNCSCHSLRPRPSPPYDNRGHDPRYVERRQELEKLQTRVQTQRGTRCQCHQAHNSRDDDDRNDPRPCEPAAAIEARVCEPSRRGVRGDAHRQGETEHHEQTQLDRDEFEWGLACGDDQTQRRDHKTDEQIRQSSYRCRLHGTHHRTVTESTNMSATVRGSTDVLCGEVMVDNPESGLVDAPFSSADPVHLATFPEQNPNAVIELDISGRVAYMNPEARQSFPDLATKGVDHPLMAGVMVTVDQLKRDGKESTSREVELDGAVFEQKVCYAALPDAEIVRIYNHDVTDNRKAERALHELARRVVDAQENERRRISRELHDEAGQALAALKISLKLLRNDAEENPEIVYTNLTEAIELVDVTRERIRMIAHDLRPPALDALGLSDTLEDFCAAFGTRTRLDIEYKGRDIAGLDDAQEICLYRLVQEALTNVAVHANASRATVEVQQRPTEVAIVVSDDGIGMASEPTQATSDEGIGLLGMRERLEMLGGRLEIHSNGEGTMLIGVIPIGESA